MFTQIKKLGLAATVSTLAFASYAYAETPMISEISVESSYSAAEGTNAAEKFPGINADLQGAIAERVQTSSDAGDPRIDVDIRKMALNGNVMLDETGMFNELEGVVSIAGDSREIGNVAFPVAIAALPGDMTPPEGYVMVAPSETDYYNVMVAAFADRVAEELDNVFTGGNEASK